jgi:outer membrane protein OmpA-like peptidoglycan-associated protein
VFLRAGGAAEIGRLQIGPEIAFSTVADGDSSAFSRTTSSLEVTVGARYRWGIFQAGLAAGAGLTHGVGTPPFRMLATIEIALPFGPTTPAEGGRGAADSPAEQKREAGAVTGLAPTQAERPASLPPPPPAPRPDRDTDGIPDAEDHCPDEAGPADADPLKNGCPRDTDGDGVNDAQDACPTEKGPRTSDPKTNGCPTSIRIQGSQIVILQQVEFESGKDTIVASSFALLREVADVLAQHPEIARVAVDGHTDDRWLTDHGVDARRLEARGFGPRRPIADNKTTEGRAKNRRVEFQIRKRTELGEAGWVSGPIE